MAAAVSTVSTHKKGGGWRKPFLIALARCGNIPWACRTVGVDRGTPHKAADANPEFAAAMQEAIEEAAGELEAKARELAIAGNAPLLIFLLKGAMPHKYRDNARVEHIGQVKIMAYVPEEGPE